MTIQNQHQTSTILQQEESLARDRFKQSLEFLFNPFIRVVPETDWSKIKAIWIPFLHHDYKNQLEKSEKLTLLQKNVDKFGTMQGYLTAPNENYIPYLTTFFNPALTQDQVIEKILQANGNILETQCVVVDESQTLDNATSAVLKTTKIIRTTLVGVSKSGMMITLIKNSDDKIIDAFPIFDGEQL